MQKTRKRVAVEYDLGLDIVARDDVTDGTQRRRHHRLRSVSAREKDSSSKRSRGREMVVGGRGKQYMHMTT